jgi:hypothetical protein
MAGLLTTALGHTHSPATARPVENRRSKCSASPFAKMLEPPDTTASEVALGRCVRRDAGLSSEATTLTCAAARFWRAKCALQNPRLNKTPSLSLRLRLGASGAKGWR